MNLIFATRPSALARWQTQWVIGALKNLHSGLECEEKVITTQGDKILDKPLPEIGGKGLFVKELEDALLAHGVVTYSIYLDPETHDLFGYVEMEDEERWAAIARTDVCQRWWRHMRDVMPANPDDSPVSRELQEVFHIERRDPGSKDPGLHD